MLRADRRLVNHLAQWFPNRAAHQNPQGEFLNDHCLDLSLRHVNLTLWGTAQARTSLLLLLLLLLLLFGGEGSLCFLLKLCRGFFY